MSNESIFKVSQVSEYIKKVIDIEEPLKYIAIYGEVSGVSNSAGSIYFSLKDENALLSCVSFGGKFSDIIKNGEQIIVYGSVKFYVKGGRLTVTVINCKPYGIGELYKQFIELKESLEKEGLFSASHKKQIPKLVKRLGVVTSPTGAVIQDIINITTRRNDGVDIVVYPVKVQGVGASEQIAKGIDFFSNYENVDVVIVARGGGSFEDLMPFNTEIVARSTYNCKKPIISAVGHETDFTIIDYVADLRAPTPSAGAELAVIDRCGEIERYKFVLDRMYNVINTRAKKDFNELKKSLIVFRDFFDGKIRLCDEKLNSNFRLAYSNISSFVLNEANILVAREKLLNAHNPTSILKRGYSIIEKNDKVISRVSDVEVGDEINIILNDGKMISVIKEKVND